MGDKVERLTSSTEVKQITRWRVCWCLRRVGRDTVHLGADHVAIDYSPSRQSAHYANLMVCGRLWQCPVCASKISEVRRQDLKNMMVLVRAGGLSSFMVTYTLAHSPGDTLPDLLKQLNEARRFFKSGKQHSTFERRYSVLGSVRALELTYGQNGWHPHIHELFVSSATDETIDFDELTDYFKVRWAVCAEKFGFTASWEHGIDLAYAGGWFEEYVAKFGREPAWDESHEIAKQVSKVSRNIKGRTPFQLLQSVADGELIFGRSPAMLFREYVAALEGKKQMVWSKHLRARLGLDVEQDDDELAAALPDDGYLLTIVDLIDWSIVLKYEQRAQLLNVASSGDVQQVVDFITQIRNQHFKGE